MSTHTRAMPHACFSRSTVCDHFSVVGLQTVFWFPNKPTSPNPSLRSTVYSQRTGTHSKQVNQFVEASMHLTAKADQTADIAMLKQILFRPQAQKSPSGRVMPVSLS